MRNFEERMNEIQKRSNARILRRRKQLTALCVPIVLVLCISTVLLLPQNITYHSAETTAPYTGSVTVWEGTKSITHTDRETVENLHHMIRALPPAESDVSQSSNHDYRIQMTSGNQIYTIVLELEDGTVHSYKLQDTLLMDKTTNEYYKLTDFQHIQLLELLKLS